MDTPDASKPDDYDGGEYVICRTLEEVDALVERVLAGETKIRAVAQGDDEIGVGLYLQDSLIWAMEQLHGN